MRLSPGVPAWEDEFQQAWRGVMSGLLTTVRNVWLPPGAGGAAHGALRYHLLDDVSFGDLRASTVRGISGGRADGDETVVIHAVLRGSLYWASTDCAARVRAGMLCVRDSRRPWHFEYGPASHARALIVPRAELRRELRCRLPLLHLATTDTPEARRLLGHLDTLATADALAPAQARIARDAALELMACLTTGGVPTAEPQLHASLRAAAERLVEERLADPELSPDAVATALHVSLRSLHRAFATGDESLMAHARRRRLERALLDLAAPDRSLNVSEIAARWQFTDTSHFVRAFKRHYGEPPARFARRMAAQANHLRQRLTTVSHVARADGSVP